MFFFFWDKLFVKYEIKKNVVFLNNFYVKCEKKIN